MTDDDDDDPPATASVARRRTTVTVLYFLVLGGIAGIVWLWLGLGILAGLGVAGVTHLLMHAPVVALRGRSILRTDRSPASVREELSSPRNPLTALWFDAADAVEARDGGRARLTASGPGGLSEREWIVEVTDGDPIRLTIRRDATVLAAAAVAVEAEGDGSRVTLATDRPRARPMTLVNVAAAGAQYIAHFAAHGYELVDGERSIGVARGRGSEPRPEASSDRG